MRRLCSLAIVVTAAAALAAPPEEKLERFKKVKKWKLTADYQASGSHEWKGGDPVQTQTSMVSVSGHGVFLLEKVEGSDWQWATPEGANPNVSVSYQGRKVWKAKGAEITTTIRYKDVNGGGASFSIDQKKGTLELGGTIYFLTTAHRTGHLPGALGALKEDKSDVDTSLSFTPNLEQDRKEEKVPSAGLVITVARTFPAAHGPMAELPPNAQSPGRMPMLAPWARASVKLTLTPAGDEDKEELVLSAVQPKDYDAWLPAPRQEDVGNVPFPQAPLLELAAKIVPKKKGESVRKAQIDFTLEDVSQHRGLCNNYPRDGQATPDLEFAPQEKQNKGVIIDGPDKAHTDGAVTEAVVRVESFDTAARGKLRARADTLGLVGEFKETKQRYLAIPRDDDQNRVADAWEKAEGVPRDTDGEADEDETPKGANPGDGMSLAHEYRGYVYDQGGTPFFTRMKPRVKELFIIDKDGAFDVALWKQATGGMVAYRFSESLARPGTDAEAPMDVDVNADGTHKLAPKLTVVASAAAASCPGKDASTMVLGCGHNAPSPGKALFTRIFKGRIEQDAKNTRGWVNMALTKPDSGPGKWVAQHRFSADVLRRALAAFDAPGGIARYVNAYVRVLAMHEVAHNCNVRGHEVATDGVYDETPVGDPACFMRYPGAAADSHQAYADVAAAYANGNLDFGYSAFCSGGQFDCTGHMNVKDE